MWILFGSIILSGGYEKNTTKKGVMIDCQVKCNTFLRT